MRTARSKMPSSYTISQHVAFILSLILTSLVLNGCIITADPDNIDKIQGSGLLETRTIDVSDFSKISTVLPGSLVISQGIEESLELSAQANLFPYIEIFVDDDGLLHIETEEDVNLEPTRPISILLTVKSINELNFAGDGLVQIDTLATTQLEVTLAGSGDIEINQLTAVLLDISLAGSGDMLLAGTVDEQNIMLAGSGDIEARELISSKAEIEIAGSGSANVNVSEELTALIVGSGSVRYLGNPTVETTIVGSGTVGPLGE
ncbi:MAG: head GIN domain-containing protein [Rhodothermales bacterium]